jgi:hypothetical protein
LKFLQVEVAEAVGAAVVDEEKVGENKIKSHQQLSCSKCSFVAKRHPDLVSCCVFFVFDIFENNNYLSNQLSLALKPWALDLVHLM